MMYNAEDESDSEEILYDSEDPLENFENLRQFIQDELNNETVTESFVVNRNEILLAILKLATIHSLSNVATKDICKMINSFLNRRVIP